MHPELGRLLPYYELIVLLFEEYNIGELRDVNNVLEFLATMPRNTVLRDVLPS